jgi:hypothetical protein
MSRKACGILISFALTTAPAIRAQSANTALACPPSDVATVGWKRVVTPDSAFTLMVPPSAAIDGSNGWDAVGMSFQLRIVGPPRPMRVGNDTILGGQPFFGDLPSGETRTSVSDGVYVSNTSMCREAIDGAAAIIESGLQSGGYAGVRGRPYVSVYFYAMDVGVFAWFAGIAKTADDQRALLAIGRSIRLLRVPRPAY